MLHLCRGKYLTPTGAQGTFPAARIIETTYTVGQRLPRHAHDHAYMVVMISGALRETALGRDHDLTRGHIVFNTAGEAHHNVVLATGTRCLNVELHPSFLSNLGASRLPGAGAVVYADAGPAIAAVGRLYDAMLDPEGGLEVEESLTELIGAAAAESEPSCNDLAWLPRAIDFLRATFRRGVLLEEMAAVAGVHRAHLCRAFRGAVGCTIGEYVRRLRADVAHQILVHNDLPLAAVAARCGYADQPHMTREIRQRYGRSPSELRRQRR